MLGTADVSPSSLIPFKPRQVLLSLSLLQQKQRNPSASTPMAQSKTDDDSILIFSVALWLQNKGFSKVLKRFCAAAQIEDEDWKAKALDLNEVFAKYQEISKSACKDFKFQAKQEGQLVNTAEKAANGTICEEVKGKKKKKSSKEDTLVNKSEEKDTAVAEKINESLENGNKDETHKESKKSIDDKVPESAEDQSTKKPKEKKKKSKLATQPLDTDVKQMDVKPEVTEQKQEGLSSKITAEDMLDGETKVAKKSKKVGAADDGIDESKKASKKRKRMPSDENDNKSGSEAAIEESKSKKPKGLEEGKGDESMKIATDNDEMDKSIQTKSASKQPKSSEPTSVKAFQRVKTDEVEFVDDRLQDNSYWAKDGAETGYGAKAQEVLGQVKGRGFRHEKTKKKRGSYRGGQIDLQSHSVKFNYSDEE